MKRLWIWLLPLIHLVMPTGLLLYSFINPDDLGITRVAAYIQYITAAVLSLVYYVTLVINRKRRNVHIWAIWTFIVTVLLPWLGVGMFLVLANTGLLS